MRVIFLDIDGVLNGHEWCHLGDSVPRINQPPARVLDCVLQATGAKVVLSSSWSRMVRAGHVTCKGFSKLLQSHGIKAEVIAAIDVGTTPRERSAAIKAWLSENYCEAFVVFDDCDLDVPNQIRTNPAVGLCPSQATQAIQRLGKGAAS